LVTRIADQASTGVTAKLTGTPTVPLAGTANPSSSGPPTSSTIDHTGYPEPLNSTAKTSTSPVGSTSVTPPSSLWIGCEIAAAVFQVLLDDHLTGAAMQSSLGVDRHTTNQAPSAPSTGRRPRPALEGTAFLVRSAQSLMPSGMTTGRDCFGERVTVRRAAAALSECHELDHDRFAVRMIGSVAEQSCGRPRRQLAKRQSASGGPSCKGIASSGRPGGDGSIRGHRSVRPLYACSGHAGALAVSHQKGARLSGRSRDCHALGAGAAFVWLLHGRKCVARSPGRACAPDQHQAARHEPHEQQHRR
jgi:hypothetical protein